MTLKDYYKTHLYEYAYNRGYDDGVAKTPNPTSDQSDIYWQDEMDYSLCADYYGMYVGDDYSWTQEDIDFLAGLGFGTGDFIDKDTGEEI